MKKIIQLIKNNEEIIRYVIVGGFTTLVSLISYYLLTPLFLNPKNPLELQIANVVSWIISVTFAFITNRKYVFKSNDSNIKKEALKFFLSRITTLLIDILFMFIMVTILKLNDKMSKILLQFIILILNYIFSKFIVFNKRSTIQSNKIKIMAKKYKYIILIFIFIFAISFLFPYTWDDWTWSLEKLSIKNIINFSKNINLNGRYFGNICVTILTKNKIVRGIIVSTVLTGIIYIISKKNKLNYSIVILLLLCMPLDMLRQSIVWTSGFANYAISTIFLLVIMIIYQKLWKIETFNSKYSFILFVLCFLGTLIIENMTIFLVLYSIIINIIYYIKRKHISFNYVLSCIGTVIGTIIMFSHPVYLNVFFGKDNYRSITTTSSSVSLLKRIFYNYQSVIKEFAIDKSIILFVLMIIVMFYYNNRKNNKNKKIINLLFIYEYLYVLYLVLKILNPNLQIVLSYTVYFEILISIPFLLIFLYLIYYIYPKNSYNLYNIIICIIGLIAPLLIVTPIGARNMFMIYVLEIILLAELYNISKIKISINFINYIVKPAILVILIGYISVYSCISIIDYQRTKYIKIMNDKNETKIVVPKMPYQDYVWLPDFDNYRADEVKEVLKVSKEIEFEFVDYGIWKYNYYNKR